MTTGAGHPHGSRGSHGPVAVKGTVLPVLATWWRMTWVYRWFWPWLYWLPGGDD